MVKFDDGGYNVIIVNYELLLESCFTEGIMVTLCLQGTYSLCDRNIYTSSL